jgi:peptidoglycan-N-acetylglucosamine deacetylase
VRVETVRPPWGRFRWSTLRSAARHGLRIVMWSLDSLDHRVKDADALAARLREVPLAPGEIVLFHDDYKHTVRALPAVLEHLGKEGWRCATVPELLARGG